MWSTTLRRVVRGWLLGREHSARIEAAASSLDDGTTRSTGANTGASSLGRVLEAGMSCPPPSLAKKATSVQGTEGLPL
jgi:hypothetical protein